MRTKRFLSIVLTLAMLLGLFPGMNLTAYAEGNTTTITPSSTSGTMTITLKIKAVQTITVSDVTATYGDTDKSVSASVTTPSTGGGAISYAVKTGSEDYIGVDASTGALTIKKVPADGKAYVIVTAAGTDDYAETTKEVTVTISKAEATITAKDQSIYVNGTVPDLSTLVLDTHYSVTGLVGTDTLTTAPTLVYQKNGSEVTPDNTTAGTYDIVPSGASAGDNYNISYTNGTLTITAKDKQTITASDIAATYGDTNKSVSATTDGNGEISYAVKAGSEDYIGVDSDGKLTIKKVPADGKAYVTVTASETNTGGASDNGYAAATKDVTVNISKAAVTITAKDQNIYVGGTVPTPEGADFYTVTGLVGEETLTTNPTLAYQKDGSAATPDNTAAGIYDIVASGASAGDNYTIAYANGTLTISDKDTQTITADDVTVTYGDTDKKISASVTDPTEGSGAISYAVKEGSGDYIEVNATTGALTIKKVPLDGKAYVTVTAAETATYAQATKEVTVTINKANATAATVTANNRTFDGTEKPLVTVTGEANGGEMQYALGTKDAAAGTYSASVPTATDAGTYYVWYKVVGDENHTGTEPAKVEVKIEAVNKDDLNKAIAEAKKYYDSIKDNDSCKEIAAELKKAIDVAEKTAEDDKATEREVGSAAKAIQAARTEAVGAAADSEAANKVIDAINALPAANKVTASDKAAINAARKAYKALTAEQKAKVPAETVKKLEKAERALAAAGQKAETKKKVVSSVTVNVKTVNAKNLKAAVKKAGGTSGTIRTIVLGKKVKKIRKGTFKNYKKAKTLVVKTRKLKKSRVKKALKGSSITKVKVQIGKKKVNKKYVKKYKKVFSKKRVGKKVKVSL